MMLSWLMAGCAPNEPNVLDKLGTTTVQVGDLKVQAWIANTNEERARGLMFVTKDQMEPVSKGVERGMVFLFRKNQRHGFWMRNTVIDLDIAFIDKDGKIVDAFTMAALDERNHAPHTAYRYVLEVKSGIFKKYGVKRGDIVKIPEDAKKDIK